MKRGAEASMRRTRPNFTLPFFRLMNSKPLAAAPLAVYQLRFNSAERNQSGFVRDFFAVLVRFRPSRSPCVLNKPGRSENPKREKSLSLLEVSEV